MALPPRVLSAASLLAYNPASIPAAAAASAAASSSAAASQPSAAGSARAEGEGGVPGRGAPEGGSAGGVLLLLGGTEGDPHAAAAATRAATRGGGGGGGGGGAAAVAAQRMTVWRLGMREVERALGEGGGCWPGCKLGEVCDLAAEVCICEAGATCAPPPLQLRSSDYAAAGRAVAHAWAIVGVSVVGALLGTAAQRGGALLLKRNRYRHVPDAAGTTWPGSKEQHDT